MTAAALATKTSGTTGAGVSGLGAWVGAEGRGVAGWVGVGATVFVLLLLGVAMAGVGVAAVARLVVAGELDVGWLAAAGADAARLEATAGLDVAGLADEPASPDPELPAGAELMAARGCPLVQPATRTPTSESDAMAAARKRVIRSG